MRDPYSVLGMSKSASGADIKKAYRKLAKKLHPDQNPSDAKAQEKFSELNAAYEILGDEGKRAQFDRGEIDAEGKPKFQGFEGFGGGGFNRSANQGPGAQHFDFDFASGGGGGGGFSGADIFSELFGSRARGRQKGPAKGEDLTASVSVPLEEIVKGGSGGAVHVTMPNGKVLEVKIPAGAEDGRQIRLRGQGYPSPNGGVAGDAIITIKLAPHDRFKVEGRDLRMDLPIALYEAVLGSSIDVPTLDGKIALNIPANSSSGRTLRLRGKGLPGADGERGALYATLKIVLPDAPDPELEALMKKWREQKPYRPRSGTI